MAGEQIEHITLQREQVFYQSPKGRLVEAQFATPAGPVTRPILRHPGAVAILAIDEHDRLLMVRQYRYPVGRWTWEIPAGTRSSDESALYTAQRELAEEAGCQAQTWHEIGSCFPAIGISDEELMFFQAKDIAPAQAQADHGEFVSAQWFERQEIHSLIADKSLCDAKTMLALSYLQWPSHAWQPVSHEQSSVPSPDEDGVF